MAGPSRSGDPLPAQPMAQATAPQPTGSVGDGNLAEPMKLEVFLHGIATIYDLPEKEVAPTEPPPKKANKRRSLYFQRGLVITLALSLIGLFAVSLSRTELPGVLPSPLYGEWKSSEPRYKDRAFMITSRDVTFRTGPSPEALTVHKIRHVDRTRGGGDTTYFSVEYEEEAGLVTWKFAYVESPKPTIRFVNQKNLIWTPSPGSAPAAR